MLDAWKQASWPDLFMRPVRGVRRPAAIIGASAMPVPFISDDAAEADLESI